MLSYRSCCEEAGFNLMRVISEPAAICLAHGIYIYIPMSNEMDND